MRRQVRARASARVRLARETGAEHLVVERVRDLRAPAPDPPNTVSGSVVEREACRRSSCAACVDSTSASQNSSASLAMPTWFDDTKERTS